MAEVEKSAPSVEEALEAALAELGVSEQEATVEVVQEPRTGVLGIGGQPAIVRVRTTGSGADAESDEAIEEQAEIAAEFVEGLLEEIGLEADIEINTVPEGTYVEVWAVDEGESMGTLIGRKGSTLDALQDLVRSVVLQRTGERCHVLIDVEDYRKRRRDQVRRHAQDASARVKRSGKPESLPPMNAYERKIAHDAVAEAGGLETASEGEEPNRRVIIRRAGPQA